jgi:prevent-host-death family protein
VLQLFHMRPSQSVGIRELRQSLSVYIERVRKGEVLRVTERGVPVAILAPLPGSQSRLQRMASAGEVERAIRDPARLGPPQAPRKQSRITLSEALSQLRADER